MGWIGQVFCLSNPEITWSLITYYDESVGTTLKTSSHWKNIFCSNRKTLSPVQPSCRSSLSALMARQNDTGAELRLRLIRFPLIFAYFTSFLNFQEFVYHCLSCLTCFQISKFCFFCQIFWLDPRSREVTDMITKINSNLIGRFIFCQYWSQLILNWSNIYGYSGSEDVVWLESSALMPKPDKK